MKSIVLLALINSLENIILTKQGLGKGTKLGSGMSGKLNAIEHLGYEQIDSISVIERVHHHVLYNRVTGYRLL